MTTPPPQGENPYAPPQPYGQPQPGAAPYAPIPPEQSNRKSIAKWIGITVLVLAGIGIAVGGYISSQDDAKTAAVGNCMHRGSTDDNNPNLEVVDCKSDKAQYVVLGRIKGKHSEDEANTKCTAEAKDFEYVYTESGDGVNFLLCLKDYAK